MKSKKTGSLGLFVPIYHFATCKKALPGLKLLNPVGRTLCEDLEQSILGVQFWLCSHGRGPKWIKSQLRLSAVCVILSLLAGYRPTETRNWTHAQKRVGPKKGAGMVNWEQGFPLPRWAGLIMACCNMHVEFAELSSWLSLRARFWTTYSRHPSMTRWVWGHTQPGSV